MKKSLLLTALCLSTLGTYAQDDDVYFVPSSKDKIESNDTYHAEVGRSTYTPITTNDDDAFSQSNWANGRGNGKWDVDTYNRRGKKYNQNVDDTLSSQEGYDQGYADGYEDGSCTARIVRFSAPRAGVIVSSPFYWDYYDICYDPFYYGYGSPWSWGWSGWYGWGSWYGWRPYYSSWSWSWGWNSPWYGGWYDPWYRPAWGCSHPYWAWHTRPLPANAQPGVRGGWTARGGSRGAGLPINNSGITNRTAYGTSSGSRGFGVGTRTNSRNNAWTPNSNSQRTHTTQSNTSGYRGFNPNSSRGLGNSNNSRSNNSYTPNRNTQRQQSTQPSQPSRSNNSSFGSGRGLGNSGSFGSGGSFGGGNRGFGGGGGRSGGRGR